MRVEGENSAGTLTLNWPFLPSVISSLFYFLCEWIETIFETSLSFYF